MQYCLFSTGSVCVLEVANGVGEAAAPVVGGFMPIVAGVGFGYKTGRRCRGRGGGHSRGGETKSQGQA